MFLFILKAERARHVDRWMGGREEERERGREKREKERISLLIPASLPKFYGSIWDSADTQVSHVDNKNPTLSGTSLTAFQGAH